MQQDSSAVIVSKLAELSDPLLLRRQVGAGRYWFNEIIRKMCSGRCLAPGIFLENQQQFCGFCS